MANTYVLLNSNTVGVGGTASVTFSSIPQTYTDLMVRISARSTLSGAKVIVQINGVTSSSYQGKNLIGTGSATSSSANSTSGYQTGLTPSTYTASAFTSADIYIPNYTLASSQKALQVMSATENNAALSEQQFNSGANSNLQLAITSINFAPDATLFAQYTTFYLYGISNT